MTHTAFNKQRIREQKKEKNKDLQGILQVRDGEANLVLEIEERKKERKGKGRCNVAEDFVEDEI